DIGVTFKIYTHVMSLQPGDREALRAIVDGGFVHSMSSATAEDPILPPGEGRAGGPRNDVEPSTKGSTNDGHARARTEDLSLVSSEDDDAPEAENNGQDSENAI